MDRLETLFISFEFLDDSLAGQNNFARKLFTLSTQKMQASIVADPPLLSSGEGGSPLLCDQATGMVL